MQRAGVRVGALGGGTGREEFRWSKAAINATLEFYHRLPNTHPTVADADRGTMASERCRFSKFRITDCQAPFAVSPSLVSTVGATGCEGSPISTLRNESSLACL